MWPQASVPTSLSPNFSSVRCGSAAAGTITWATANKPTGERQMLLSSSTAPSGHTGPRGWGTPCSHSRDLSKHAPRPGSLVTRGNLTQAEMPEPARNRPASPTRLSPTDSGHQSCPSELTGHAGHPGLILSLSPSARPTQAQGRAPRGAPGLPSLRSAACRSQLLLSRLLHSASQVWRCKLFSNGLCTAPWCIC